MTRIGRKYPSHPRNPRLIKSVSEIVRAKAEDAEILTEIAHAAKRHWRYPENWIEAWRDILTMRPEFIAANIACVAVENERAVGFYILTKEPDGPHLDHLWVLPDSMGRGIGRALFEHAAAQARQSGSGSIRIEADPNSEAFYKRMGAVRVGTASSEVCGVARELPVLVYRVE